MRAVVLHEYAGPDKLQFEDKLSGGRVLIGASAASLNPIDWETAFRKVAEGFSVERAARVELVEELADGIHPVLTADNVVH